MTQPNPTALRAKKLTLEHAGKQRAVFLSLVPHDHPIEAVLNPDYFGAMILTSKIAVGDIIQVEWEDGTKFGELQVRAIEPSVHQLVTAVRTLNEYDPPQMPDGWSSEYRGGDTAWVIKFEGQTVQAGFKTLEEAAMRAELMARQKLVAASARPKSIVRGRAMDLGDGAVNAEEPQKRRGRPPKAESENKEAVES